jgi:hypothetical protein
MCRYFNFHYAVCDHVVQKVVPCLEKTKQGLPEAGYCQAEPETSKALSWDNSCQECVRKQAWCVAWPRGPMEKVEKEGS